MAIKPNKSSNRRRTDPVVTLSTIFESILNEMRDLPNMNTQPFLFPVNAKNVPDYYRIIKKPMDLQQIREGIRSRKYLSRESFITDINQVVINSELYNGPKSFLTQTAQRMMELCLLRIAEKEDKLMRLEKAINPLLDDNDLVAFSFILASIVNDRLKTVENSWPFHAPVKKKFVKDYYEVIKKPMDLGTLLMNVNAHMYHNREQFLEDVELVVVNSQKYNGIDSAFTQTAHRIMQIAQDAISEQDEQISMLEENIRNAQEAALEAAETDSVITGTSLGADLESLGSMNRENVTIAEDANDDPASMRQQNAHNASSANLSRDDDFVDVEGDEEHGGTMDRSHGNNETVNSSLADDLQMSPENSDDDMEYSKFSSKLSSSGSDSEMENDAPNSSHFAPMDENAQDYGTGMEGNPQESTGHIVDMSQMSYDDNGEDSFDPTEFFSSFGKNPTDQQSQPQQTTSHDINSDLAVSDSEEEDDDDEEEPMDEGRDFEEVEESQDNQDFNLDEFLQQD